MAQTVLNDIPTRIKAAVDDVKDARDAYELALQQRDELIVEAIDSGMSQKAVAAMVGVAKGRISAILAGSQPDEE